MKPPPILAVLGLALLSGCAGPGTSPEPPTAPPASAASPAADQPGGGLYGESQARGGRRVFRQSCARCHYSSEMRGTPFQATWGRLTVGDLYAHLVEAMPEDDPGSLSETEYLEVVAYILSLNGFPAGSRELSTGSAAFRTRLEAAGGGRSREISSPRVYGVASPVTTSRP